MELWSRNIDEGNEEGDLQVAISTRHSHLRNMWELIQDHTQNANYLTSFHHMDKDIILLYYFTFFKYNQLSPKQIMQHITKSKYEKHYHTVVWCISQDLNLWIHDWQQSTNIPWTDFWGKDLGFVYGMLATCWLSLRHHLCEAKWGVATNLSPWAATWVLRKAKLSSPNCHMHVGTQYGR